MAIYTVYNQKDIKEVFDKVSEMLGDKNLKAGYVITVDKDNKNKTIWQIKTFYSLLNSYYESQCSSASSLEELKLYYKDKIGLVVKKQIGNGISLQGREILNQILDISGLPMSAKDKTLLEEMASGTVLEVISFADATKGQMSDAIKLILEDIDVSGASSYAPCQRILEGLMNNINDWM